MTGANRNSASDEVTMGVRNIATLVTGTAKSAAGSVAGDWRLAARGKLDALARSRQAIQTARVCRDDVQVRVRPREGHPLPLNRIVQWTNSGRSILNGRN